MQRHFYLFLFTAAVLAGTAVAQTTTSRPSAEPPTPRLVVVRVREANLRAAPQSQAAVVARVPFGTLLEVVGRRGTWYEVVYREAEPIRGFIAVYLVEPAEEPVEPAPQAAPPQTTARPGPAAPPAPNPMPNPAPQTAPPPQTAPNPTPQVRPSWDGQPRWDRWETASRRRRRPDPPPAFGILLLTGYVKPQDFGGTVWPAAEFRARVAWFDPVALTLGLEAGFWSRSETEVVPIPVDDFYVVPVNVKGSMRDINIVAPFGVLVRAVGPLWFAASVGPGLHIVRAAVSLPDFPQIPEAAETQTKFGLALSGGPEVALSEAFALQARVRYDIVSDVNQFKVYGGIVLRF